MTNLSGTLFACTAFFLIADFCNPQVGQSIPDIAGRELMGTGVYQHYNLNQRYHLNLARLLNAPAAESAELAFAYPLSSIANPDRSSASIARLQDFHRTIYGSNLESWSSTFLAEQSVETFSIDTAIEGLLAFNKTIYEDNPDTVTALWDAHFVDVEVTEGAAIERLLAFDRTVYESNTDALSELWALSSRSPNVDALSAESYPIEGLLSFYGGDYSNVSYDAAERLLAVNPEWRLTASFEVAGTDNEVLAGVDADYFFTTDLSNLYVVTESRVQAPCIKSVYCDSRVLSWNPAARVSIITELPEGVE